MFGAIVDFTVPGGRVLMFGGKRLVVLLEDCLDIPFHGEAAGALLVVPVKVNNSVLLSFPVSGDGVVFFKNRYEVFGVAFLHIFDAEII